MKRLAFYYDSNVCSGCKTCQIACKDKNNLPEGVNWRRVYEVSGGSWVKDGNAWKQNILAYYISMSCNHCEDPICLKGCPAKAITKTDEGIVRIDPEKCMGCKYCSWSCPYGAMQFNEKAGIMGKCDLCEDYVMDGKNPSCVDACPTRALDFGEYETLVEKYGRTKYLHPLPEEEITQPSLLIHPHRDALREENRLAVISNMEEVDHD